MSGPDRIFAKQWKHAKHSQLGVWSASQQADTTEYIRRDPAVLAALPEVQALIAGVLELAASMLEDNVRHAKDLGHEIWPIPDLRTLTPADAIAARVAMITAAIRKRGEG